MVLRSALFTLDGVSSALEIETGLWVVLRAARAARGCERRLFTLSSREQVDPVLMAWLAEPDSTEAELALPALYSRYMVGAGAGGAAAAGHAALGAEPGGAEQLEADLRACWALCGQLCGVLKASHGPAGVAVMQRELTVAQVLTDMELHGLPLHLPTLRRPLGEVQRRCEALSREAEALLGGPLNLGSPQQVSEALYARLTLC